MVMFAIHLAQYRNITGLIVDNGHDRRKSDDPNSAAHLLS